MNGVLALLISITIRAAKKRKALSLCYNARRSTVKFALFWRKIVMNPDAGIKLFVWLVVIVIGGIVSVVAGSQSPGLFYSPSPHFSRRG